MPFFSIISPFVSLVVATSGCHPVQDRSADRIASREHALAICKRRELLADDIRPRSRTCRWCEWKPPRDRSTHPPLLPSSPKETQRILEGLGNLRYFQGAMEQAISYFRQALHIVTARNDMWEKARILGNLGACFLHTEEHERLHLYTEQAFLAPRTLIPHAAHMLNNSGAPYLSFEQSDLASFFGA